MATPAVASRCTAPPPKRTKLVAERSAIPPISDQQQEQLPTGVSQCLSLLSSALATNDKGNNSALPPPTLLSSGQKRNSLSKLKALFDEHGFRTSVVTSPREALSIYKDSCLINDDSNDMHKAGKEYLISMLGLHPDQNEIERWYSASMRDVYCLLLFCQFLRTACTETMEDNNVKTLIEKFEAECRDVANTASNIKSTDSPKAVASSSLPPLGNLYNLSSTASERVSSLIAATINADHKIRKDQLEREYNRLKSLNSTYANALVQLFLDAHHCTIKEIVFKGSHAPKYERLTIYLYVANIDMMKPPRFTFLPGLRRAIDDGPEAVAEDMVTSFWAQLLRHGYFATTAVKEAMAPDLNKFFLSGISNDPTQPLLLNAHFSPTFPLSFYLHGKAGSGKSSLVRNFSPALNGTVEEYCDPEVMVRFVKQNLNKPQKALSLELELRPNNNDLSVMSIIQGRRMTLTQSKPGLVVVGLEELASDESTADPNQADTCRVISQRFSGRKGDFRLNEKEASKPRNSDKRGISGDATIVTLFTSNYDLGKSGGEALRRLDMFSNLMIIEMSAVSGEDRLEFAHTYIGQCISYHFAELNPYCEIKLNIPVGSGDTRPLVRHLRMLSFFVCSLVAGNVAVGSSISATITHDAETKLTTVCAGGKSLQLREGSMDNLYPMVPHLYDSRAESTMKELQKLLKSPIAAENIAELTQIFDFYYTKTLAPAVVISNNADLIIQNIVAAVAAQENVHSIAGVDPINYKMMKSLYDPTDTPNLRDDILNFGKGACVAVELNCKSRDAQLLIREIIEDTPSMTAFSSNKSALYKDGLFFGVYVDGEITPELQSRASLIL